MSLSKSDTKTHTDRVAKAVVTAANRFARERAKEFKQLMKDDDVRITAADRRESVNDYIEGVVEDLANSPALNKFVKAVMTDALNEKMDIAPRKRRTTKSDNGGSKRTRKSDSDGSDKPVEFKKGQKVTLKDGRTGRVKKVMKQDGKAVVEFEDTSKTKTIRASAYVKKGRGVVHKDA